MNAKHNVYKIIPPPSHEETITAIRKYIKDHPRITIVVPKEYAMVFDKEAQQ